MALRLALWGWVARGLDRAKQVRLAPEPEEKADQLPNTPSRLAGSAAAGTARLRAIPVKIPKILFMLAPSPRFTKSHWNRAFVRLGGRYRRRGRHRKLLSKSVSLGIES